MREAQKSWEAAGPGQQGVNEKGGGSGALRMDQA